MLRLLLLKTLLVATFLTSFSQTLRFHTRIQTSTGNPVVVGGVNDAEYVQVPLPSGPTFLDTQKDNYITLGINHNYAELMSVGYNLEIELEVTPFTIQSGIYAPDMAQQFTIPLDIKFDPYGNNAYKDKDTYYVSNSHLAYKYKITSILLNGINTNTLPANVYIDGDIECTRIYDLDPTEIAVVQAPQLQDLDCNGDNDQITLQWDPVTGAVEYQLEWTFVNDYNATVGPTSTIFQPIDPFVDDINYDFRFNSTRVTVKQDSYSIPLILDRGYLLYRVRPVGYTVNTTTSTIDGPIYGDWVLPTDQTVDNALTNHANNCYHVTTAHEQKKNWQLTTIYAEEGKKKEVVSYMDGTMRNRQSVTKTNTENNVVVGETIYDHQGRPAVNVLPVPVLDAPCVSTESNVIKHYPNFNVNASGQAYSKLDFDKDAAACSTSTGAMDNSSGAAQYYSDNNPNLTNQQAYLPKADGFPFSVVEYTPDNTGRISRQSGVGPEFQLDSEHETKYLYGKPGQLELDRLFGSEAGNANHHKKNMVIDPNGQVTVSYLDMQGRVVATALSGDNPNNLEAITINPLSQVTLSEELIAQTTQNQTSLGNYNQLQLSETFLVASKGDYDFTYELETSYLDEDCLEDICFSCVYDLSISITDECAQQVPLVDNSGSPIQIENQLTGHFSLTSSGAVAFNVDCNGDYTNTLSFSADDLKVGSYNLVKTLSLNTDAKQYYLSRYLDPTLNSCIRTYQDFEDEYMAAIDCTACYIDCDICIEDLGEVEDFVSDGRGSADNYYELLEECEEACKLPTSCELAYEMMLVDVSPHGQYGACLNAAGDISVSEHYLSVFNYTSSNRLGLNNNWKNPTTPYVDDLGNLSYLDDGLGGLVSPQNVDIETFINNWEDSWAKSLVEYHPEYCYYENCVLYEQENNEGVSSEFFDAQLRNSNFAKAEANGWIVYNASLGYYELDMVAFNDPVGLVNASVANALLFDLGQISGGYYNDETGQPMTMLELAAFINNCGSSSIGLGTINTNCLKFCVNGTLDEDYINASWNTFVAIYLGEKHKLIKQQADAAVINTSSNCYNGCIGNEEYNPFLSGFNWSSFFNSQEPCSFFNMALYRDKQQRFVDVNVDFNLDEANYQIYELTGACPQELNLVNLMSEIAATGNLLNSTNISSFNAFSAFHLAMNNFDYSIPILSTDYQLISQSANSITFNISDASSNCNTMLVASSSVIWSDVVGFYTVRDAEYTPATNQSVFTVDALLSDGSMVELQGTTCFVLGNCEFPMVCEPTELANELVFVMSKLAINNDFQYSSSFMDLYNSSSTGYSEDVDAPNIKALFNPSPSAGLPIQWNYNGSDIIRVRSSLGKTLELRLSDYSLPFGFTLNDIGFFWNLNSNFENNFTIDVYLNNFTSVVWEGECFLDGAPFSLGDCADPQSILCDEIEHENLEELELLIEDIFSSYIDGSPTGYNVPKPINLSANPLLTSQLATYLPSYVVNGHYLQQVISPGTGHPSYPANVVAPNGRPHYWSLSIGKFGVDPSKQYLINTGDCAIEMHFYAPYNTEYELTDISNFRAVGDLQNNNQYSFSFTATAVAATFSFKVDVYGSSCIPLKNCEDCDEDYIIDVVQGQEPTFEMDFPELVNLFEDINIELGRDTLDTNYIYVPKLDLLIVEDFDLFIKNYIRFLSHFNPDVDNIQYLYDIDLFIREHGETENVYWEYDRYSKAVDKYNERALVMGQPAMAKVSKTVFIKEGYAHDCPHYVDHLSTCLAGNWTLPLAIDQVLPVSQQAIYNELSPAVSAQKYEQYVDAYNFHMANVANPELSKATASLTTIENIKANNLLSSTESVQVFDKYVQDLYDVTHPPRALPKFDPYIKEVEFDEIDCSKAYRIYRKAVRKYNRSVFALEHDHQVKGYGYKKIFKNGYCDCLLEYVAMLEQYISASSGSLLPLPAALFKWDGCKPITDPYEDCRNNVKLLVKTIRDYNQFVYHSDNNGFFDYLPYNVDADLIIEEGLCPCLEPYIAHLQSITQPLPGSGIPSKRVKRIVRKITLDYDHVNLIDAIREFCTDPCDNGPIAYIEPVYVPYTNPCIENMINAAIYHAEQAYEEYINELTLDFETRYENICVESLNESFVKSYDQAEHHYTLYYYDQAGNLVKTIPPAGVEFMDITSSSDPIAIQIQQDRNNNDQTVFTNHRLETKYVYNSLNQLVKQVMPDHNTMDIWNLTLPNGLDANLRVEDIDFVSSSKGYLTGWVPFTTVGGKEVERGYLYTTTNGGSNWTRVHDLVGNNINAIEWISSSSAYAVGDHGGVLFTEDKGSSWDLVSLVANDITENLNDLCFQGNYLLMAGNNNALLEYDIANDSYSRLTPVSTNSAFAFTTNEHFTSVVFDDNANEYVMSVDRGNYSMLYRSSDRVNWTPQENLKASELNAISVISSSKAIIGGDKGLLLATNDGGDSWLVKESGHRNDFNAVYFKDDFEGVAIIGTHLYATHDGGASWTVLDDTRDYNSISEYVNNSTDAKVVAATQSGEVVRVIMNNNTPFGIVPNSITSAEVFDVYVLNNKGVAVAADGMYYTSNVGSGTWTNVNVYAAARKIRFVEDGADLVGAFITNSDDMHKFRVSAGALTIYSAFLSSDFSGIAVKNSSTIAAYNHQSKQYYELDASTFTFSSPAFINNTTVSSTATMLSDDNGGSWLVTTTGEIVNYNGAEVNATNNVRAAKINDLAYHANELVGVGDYGKVYYDNGTKLFSSMSQQQLNAVDLGTSGINAFGYAVGNQGTILKIHPGATIPASGYLFSAGISDDYSDVSIYNLNPSTANVRACTKQGKIYGLEFWGMSLKSTQNAPLNALSINGPTMLLGGDNSHCYIGNLNFVLKTPQVFTGKLVDASFNLSGKGAVVGEDYLVRSTTGGGSFSVVHPQNGYPAGFATQLNAVEVAGGNVLIGGTDAYLAKVVGSSTVATAYSATIATGNSVKAIKIATGGNGYLVTAGSSSGKIYSTANSGNTWTSVATTSEPLENLHHFEHNNSVAVVGSNGYNAIYSSSNGLNPLPSIGTADLKDVAFYDDVIGYAVGSSGTIHRTDNVSWVPLSPQIIDYLVWDAKPLADNVASQNNAIDKNIEAIAIATRNKVSLGGNYNASAGYARLLKDESQEFSTHFYYDALGRMVASQNTKQYNASPKKYDYTLYDELGRVIEGGVKTDNNTSGLSFESIFGAVVGGAYVPSVVDEQKLLTWIFENGNREQVTHSYYDNYVDLGTSAFPTSFSYTTDNLRKRIASITYEELYDGTASTFDVATHYSYDIHGNVKVLLQDNQQLQQQLAGSGIDMRFKQLDYSYDLISGNVNSVSYQADQPDQWHHRYTYDADNRIVNVITSTDNISWDEDTRYFYYDHGPLARLELGENNVQGTDYAYTLQGWIKGVNSDLLSAQNDMGKDGLNSGTNPNGLIARDAMGYSLNYFENDYNPIDPVLSPTASFNSSVANLYSASATASLYNGNIGAMVTTLKEPIDLATGTATIHPQAMAYKYDQLNRLIESNGFDNLTASTNAFSSTPSNLEQYRNKFEYDANGNITYQLRKDQLGVTIDELEYQYNLDGSGNILNNQLTHVIDPVNYNGEDLVTQNSGNYTYDEIGQLTADEQEEIKEIVWRADGKIKSISRVPGSTADNLTFDYDASGNRSAKHLYDNNTGSWKYSLYYLRDATGNPMAVYKHELSSAGSVSFLLHERNIYGSSRVGLNKQQVEMTSPPTNAPNYYNHTLGERQYELSNHLGNVLSVVTDRKYQIGSGTTVDYFEPEIIHASDYYPFGAPMDERTFSTDSYRYGFGGHEKDDEVKGSGNSYDMGARMYDPRIGRTPTIDPHASTYPAISPYAYAANTPIQAIDPDGKDVILVIWATNKQIGHAAIAVSNYKAVQREVEVTVPAVNPGSKGPDGYSTTMTQTITEYVPDGTYTYYDNWPSQGVNLSGVKGALKTVDAYRSHDPGEAGVIIGDISEFTSGNITTAHPYDPTTKTGIPNEDHMQDGVLKINTGYATDQEVKATLEGLNANKTKYNGKGFNCATYAGRGIETLTGQKVGVEKVLGPFKATTPNQLWHDTKAAATNGGYTIDVLVDPGNKASQPYKQGLYNRATSSTPSTPPTTPKK